MSRPRGLQKHVFKFYREVLRACRSKDVAQRSLLHQHARQQLERYRTADRKDYQLVEFLLRRGKRQMQLATSSNVKLSHLHSPLQESEGQARSA